MLKMAPRLRFLLICLTIAHFTHAVDLDYYFGALRSEETCNNVTEKIYCHIQCGLDTGVCVGNVCYCLSMKRLKEYAVKGLKNGESRLLNQNEDSQEFSDFNDYNESNEQETQYDGRNGDTSQMTPEYLDESLLNDKPILRHHIAHFCPNLDVAKDCIRTCMKSGKPAFCGKDHVCYCGHRYSNKDIDRQVDASTIYAQFKDLYDKYFGPNYKPDLHV